MNVEPITNHATRFSSLLQCGQDLCIGTDLPEFITYNCDVEYSAESFVGRFNIYKDNTYYNDKTDFTLLGFGIVLKIPDDLGTYKAVLNASCGIDVATSILSLCGKHVIYLYTNV